MSDWIKFTDKQAPLNVRVIASDGHWVGEATYTDSPHNLKPKYKWLWYGKTCPWPVTHWMPLPQPPATGRGET